VSAGQSRSPLTVPIWYQYSPGGEAWVLTSASWRKARLIEAAGRFTLMVDRLAPTVRLCRLASHALSREAGLLSLLPKRPCRESGYRR